MLSIEEIHQQTKTSKNSFWNKVTIVNYEIEYTIGSIQTDIEIRE